MFIRKGLSWELHIPILKVRSLIDSYIIAVCYHRLSSICVACVLAELSRFLSSKSDV